MVSCFEELQSNNHKYTMPYYHVKYSIRGTGSTSHRTDQLLLNSPSPVEATQKLSSKYRVNPSDITIKEIY